MNGQLSIFEVHTNENNVEMQIHLDKNRDYFSAQCTRIFDLLMSGQILTVFGSLVHHKISSLPRRILDLKQNGVQVSDAWDYSDGGRKIKHWYMTMEQIQYNRKFLNNT